MSKERKFFCDDSMTLNQKDSTEQISELKNVGNKAQQLGPGKEKKVLEIGL